MSNPFYKSRKNSELPIGLSSAEAQAWQDLQNEEKEAAYFDGVIDAHLQDWRHGRSDEEVLHDRAERDARGEVRDKEKWGTLMKRIEELKEERLRVIELEVKARYEMLAEAEGEVKVGKRGGGYK